MESFSSPMSDLKTMRHSAAHILAQAVVGLFPEARLGIGPATEDGFYYDFELPRPLSEDDLPQIEERMREIVSWNLPFVPEEVGKEKVKEMFDRQPYKQEIISELQGDRVTVYHQGDFYDLCRGPHLSRTSEIGPFKLLRTSGAYWRGDEKEPMLQRIYGTCFESQERLDLYLQNLAEAERRDHRRLGKELDLFSVHEGLVLWHPKGAIIRSLIEDFWRQEHLKRGYQLVYTPHILNQEVFQKSGHLAMYQEFLYPPMSLEGKEYRVKPMNCPGHIMIYQSRLRSYRDLPLRLAELGTVYRYERSGTLHGLLRVRGFTQDDAHIFCSPDQVESEISEAVKLCQFMLGSFGFEEYEFILSTRPEKYAGTLEMWGRAESQLQGALTNLGLSAALEEGGGVFYGPKVDIKLYDSLGRGWQGPTIQLDFNLPQRFEVGYIGPDGGEHQVVMIHRAVLGSMERFIACLTEHYGGAFPVWLSPTQAVIIPIADRHISYARGVEEEFKGRGVRVEVDARSERMNLKVREAILQRIPYILVVGDKEERAGTVSLRLRSGEDLGSKTLPELWQIIQPELKPCS